MPHEDQTPVRITEGTNHPGASEKLLKSTHSVESLAKSSNRNGVPWPEGDFWHNKAFDGKFISYSAESLKVAFFIDGDVSNLIF